MAEQVLRRVERDQAARAGHALRAREVARQMAALLAHEPGVRRVWLFGSLAGGLVHERSDIDLAVEGLSPEREAATTRRLEAMTDLPLDLVRLEDVLEPMRERILTDGELLYVAR